MFGENSNKNGIHNLRLREARKHLSDGKIQKINILKFSEINPWMRIILDYEFHLDFCRNLLADPAFKELMDYPKDLKFNLILYDSLSSLCLLVFYEKFDKPPLIKIQSIYKESLLQDEDTTQSYEHKPIADLSFKDRILDFLFRIFRSSFNEKLISNSNEILDKHFLNIDLKDILNAHKIILKNSHFIMRYPGEDKHNAINVGGLHININQSERLFKTIRPRKGIILFNLGNEVKAKDLEQKRLDDIILAFELLSSYTIIWVSSEELDLDDFSLPENLLINHDYSQQEILEHPKTRLFITTGDFLSVQESVWFGVPILGVPIFPHQKGVSCSQSFEP
jgi:glucuronosyltransferase